MAADQSNDGAPQYLLQLLKNAAAHHSSGDLEKAEQHYLRILDHGYRRADIHLLLARIAAKRGNLETAIGHLDKMNSIHIISML